MFVKKIFRQICFANGNYNATKCDVCGSQVNTIYNQGLHQHIFGF